VQLKNCKIDFTQDILKDNFQSKNFNNKSNFFLFLNINFFSNQNNYELIEEMLNTCLAHKSDAVFNVSNHNTGNMTIGKLGLKKLKNNKQCNNMKFSIIDDFSLYTSKYFYKKNRNISYIIS
jgi:hypothetical protein